ncbi:VOC family protein [Limoniibacter endophyticus]|uniref:Glyoxalase/bleomycin resistance protein/dioxygenase n=1 Tax=Limoniibacter endophyticus TaxID=1565040 RepID=A0A8J3DL81_9HYPH|nr:VOC family protein [Limoniibacter endophyticus]GHC60701.1 glyoxalase/bleomycin resistance protein/dioxygenase [Limoniibacter endophyticus]
MSNLPFSATTPIHIGSVGLIAKDGEKLSSFYRNLLGLEELSNDGSTRILGTRQRPLLTITEDKNAAIAPRERAGLFHTAFLFKDRVDLSRWVGHVAEKRIRISGASDHNVSEAFYLDDPEGNGIEVYTDRDENGWRWNDGLVDMVTKPLDIQNLMALAENADTWISAPDNLVIGHVHLKVGEISAAETFWTEKVGLKTVAYYGDKAVFLSSGGYHHHIAANIWGSAGAGERPEGETGLDFVELVSRNPLSASAFRDPWGTKIQISTN